MTAKEKALFAKHLRILRGVNGLTQTQLGRRLGTSPATIGAWESPDPSMMPSHAHMQAIIALFGVTELELLARDLSVDCLGPHD